ncbi:uncharacterized protein TRIADDRAFT_30578 [Trichoplax adhaerens]|uniref:Phospholipase A2 n=1 Tax=Trichoplax adhaerens TaxID=10228 RepID=B3S7T2_TRIAD|nr:hypothetical protein TRIADDRAFT_30578 [Trichoplax adhaerens]EDV21346.1 hypothetical protein TRIADDRAFT_30578 [Trichoplax adhaerens]|eukprot:XP_002116313.1 hypothetical protein TRIADDRAFT_30578 [Trichoplax adhaerens]
MQTKTHRKNLFNLYYMMKSRNINRNPAAYYGYGNYCGWGSRGNHTVDKTDICCMNHDKCYQKTNCKGLYEGKFNFYSWEVQKNEIICKSSFDTCDQANCECDKALVLCLEKAPYNCEHVSELYKFFC